MAVELQVYSQTSSLLLAGERGRKSVLVRLLLSLLPDLNFPVRCNFFKEVMSDVPHKLEFTSFPFQPQHLELS